jgi:hypothetical protein
MIQPNGTVLHVNPLTRAIPTYQSNKTVQALKIAHLIANPRGIELHFVDQRFVPMQIASVWVTEHNVMEGGYLIIGDGGYPSYSPAAAFEATYKLIPGEDE